MTTAFLLRAICMGNIALFANSLGQLCDIPVRRVEAAMGAGRRPAFRALYIKSGLPDRAFEVFANAVDSWRKVLATGEAADGARLTWLVTRDVLSAYRGNTDHAVDGLLVLLRRLAAEAARSNARSHAGRITSQMREREQQLLEARAADPMIAILEAFPVIEVPEPVLVEFAVHFAEEIVDLEERIANGELAAEAEAAQWQLHETGDAANDDFDPDWQQTQWGEHPLLIDLGDANRRSRAA
jgi:SH3-like domain-containing protein